MKMSKYQKKFGVNTSGLSHEAHRKIGQATCGCGAVVATNQEGKLWAHNEPNTGRFCLRSWTRPA